MILHAIKKKVFKEHYQDYLELAKVYQHHTYQMDL
jgi:hypothetical protein